MSILEQLFGSGYAPGYDDPACNVGPQGINTLYRVLRPEEEPDKGLVPKNEADTRSHELHVSHGSRTKTRFISTTKDKDLAERWLCKAGAPDSKIVKIKVDQPLRDRLIDVSCGQNLSGVMAKNFALSSKEVIVDGRIPAKNMQVIHTKRPSDSACADIEKEHNKTKDAKRKYIKEYHRGQGRKRVKKEKLTPTYDDPACLTGTPAIKTLYRVLGPEEPFKDGIDPKNAASTKSHKDHVLHGNQIKTRFISTTKDKELAERWLCYGGAPNSKIVRINVDKDLRDRLIDVSCGQDLTGTHTKAYARNSKEVLVEGRIPAKNIEVIADKRPGEDVCEERERDFKKLQKAKQEYMMMHNLGFFPPKVKAGGGDSGGTTDRQIEQRLAGVKNFIGVFSADTLPDPSTVPYDSCLVSNYSDEARPGTHWVAILHLNNPRRKPEFFDSFGFGPDDNNSILKTHAQFQDYLQDASRKAGHNSQFLENRLNLQCSDSDVCGEYCCFAILSQELPENPSNGCLRPQWKKVVDKSQGCDVSDARVKRIVGMRGRQGSSRPNW